MIRHLIFDMDGTLVDSCAICVEILSGMLADRGSDHVIDAQAARSYMSRGGVQMVAALLGPACGDAEAELAEFRARYQRVTTPSSALFDGVQEGLQTLHGAGFVLSICSNKPQILCEGVLADTGHADLFRVVVGGQQGFAPKPAPDLLEATLDRLGARVEQCLFIGDSELDHQVAEAIGMPFLFLTYGYAEPGWQPGRADSFDCFTSLTQSVMTRFATPVRAV